MMLRMNMLTRHLHALPPLIPPLLPPTLLSTLRFYPHFRDTSFELLPTLHTIPPSILEMLCIAPRYLCSALYLSVIYPMLTTYVMIMTADERRIYSLQILFVYVLSVVMGRVVCHVSEKSW